MASNEGNKYNGQQRAILSSKIHMLTNIPVKFQGSRSNLFALSATQLS